jgi:plasmid stabilization system protein ParE
LKRIEFTETAEQELVLAAAKIGQDDEAVAERFLERVYEVLDNASQTPGMTMFRTEETMFRTEESDFVDELLIFSLTS